MMEERRITMPKKYSNDLKRSVVRHYRNNLSISEVSTVYDIPRKTVEKWLTKYRKEGDYAFDEYEYNQQKYIENLEKKVKKQEDTIELLKKALAFLHSNQSKEEYL